MWHAAALVAILGWIAMLAPEPRSTHRDFYQKMGRAVLIPHCADIHCFRPLVAVVLEHLPGPSAPKWKAYSVVANAAAAVATARFAVLLGASPAGGLYAMWLSGLGAGALYTLYDPFTSDPLMYMLGPIIAILLWQGRTVRASVLSAVGVFAKEFAAAPLWIFAVMAGLQRRWRSAVRLLLAAMTVTLVWLTIQTSLMVVFDYSYGDNHSPDVLHGGYLLLWIRSVGPIGAATYVFTTFGAVYLLFVAGLWRGGPDVRVLTVAAVPALAALVYVQQPERALWNFHFIVVPIAVLALEELPGWSCWLFILCFSAANLRFGAQLTPAWIAHASFVASLLIAAVACWKSAQTAPPESPPRTFSAATGRSR